MQNVLKTNLSGGMNVKTSPLIIKDTEVELALNYHLDTVGALTKRLGYATYASQPVAGKTCNGLFQFNNTTSGVGYQLYVANNAGDSQGVIYYNNAGTWTVAKNNDTSTRKSRFFSFVDYVFRVNGINVVATSTNGATWGTTNAPATIAPKFGAVFQDRCYLASGLTTNQSRVWFSSLPSAGAITWDTVNDYFDVNPDDGDKITGLENNGNRLLIFKNRAMYRWTFGQVEPDRLIGVGTSSQESVKTNLDVGITFFANQRGVYAYTGARPKLISRKIQKFVDAVTDWANVFGETDGDHYYLAVGDLTVDGRTYTNAMFVYHISLDAWTIYTTATKVTWMAKLMPDTVEYVYFGDNTGRTYQFLTGLTDNASTIFAEMITKEYMLSFPELTEVRDIFLIAQNRLGANVLYQTDRNNKWINLQDLKNRVQRLSPKTNECNTVQLKVTDNSVNTSIIEGFNFSHEVKNTTR